MSAEEVIHHHRIHHHRGRGNAERSRWRGQKRDWSSPPALREGGKSNLVRGGNAHTQPSEADAAGGAPGRLEASDDSDPSAKGAPSGGQGHKKRSAVDLAAASLLPTAKAAPDGAAPDLPTGLTSVRRGISQGGKDPLPGGVRPAPIPTRYQNEKVDRPTGPIRTSETEEAPSKGKVAKPRRKSCYGWASARSPTLYRKSGSSPRLDNGSGISVFELLTEPFR
jgi:hypothetical protein